MFVGLARLKSDAVPDSGIACGLPAALLVTISDPLRFPLVVGLKTRLKVQLPPIATEPEQLFVCE